jgi:ribosomal protein L11
MNNVALYKIFKMYILNTNTCSKRVRGKVALTDVYEIRIIHFQDMYAKSLKSYHHNLHKIKPRMTTRAGLLRRL